MRESPQRTLRWRVWLHRVSLDRRLARGDDDADEPALELRAQQLGTLRLRRGLADSLESTIERAAGPPRPASSQAPVNWMAIRALQPLMLTLVEELRAPGPVRVQGVALARALLIDGGSPLYAPCERELLEGAINEVRHCL